MGLGIIVDLYFFVYLFPFSELEQAIVRYVRQATPAFLHYLLHSKLLAALLGVNFAIGVVNQVQFY